MSAQITLANSDLFARALYDFTLTKAERQEIVHARAKAIAMSFNFTTSDVFTCSEKFWDWGVHPINLIDVAASALASIHVNLTIGTLSEYIARPEVAELCRKLLAFEVSGHYMLTEVAHGLDSQNIETTATLLEDGGFDFHTPHPGAAKFMPATIVAGGVPKMTIIMARLIVQGSDRGIRPFAVNLNDGETMCPGVSCRYGITVSQCYQTFTQVMNRSLPDRSGTRPMGHAITYFNHVKLPATALIGHLETKLSPRLQFLSTIWRLGVGSATLSGMVVPALRISAHITAKYAKQRMVTNSAGNTASILSFRTTQAPILRALSQAAALEAFYREIRPYFSALDNSNLVEVLDIRNGLADVFKTVAVHHWRETSIILTDRLGARGLFTENQLISMEMELRGMTIAEGDVLVLCIRLASELLIGRYQLPAPRNPSSLLAMHEGKIFSEMRGIFEKLGKNHRSEEFNRILLPRCIPLVIAIGQRMAFEAALDAHVEPDLVAVYEASAVLQDLAWYVENGLTTREVAIAKEVDALTRAFVILDQVLDKNGCEPYIHTPILSSSAWANWVATLPLHECAKL
ncbi:Acyl-CoA dehydrogenase NM domain-like protein [Mycena venus]|uniref:Acyl-CoA dehydrogenase NM domain-like protein n=1 Tax=Mycena venus TaxID=2733690 RepID=A0A8H6YDS7_9AGAR|nr:Acyl-CoA dehydrogenase NM domain-like protein [Mycena venus]